MEKIEISNFLDSIAIEAFRKGIKRDISLFIKLTKPTPHFLERMCEEAQKIVNVEKALKSSSKFMTKKSLDHPRYAGNRDFGDKNSYIDRRPNLLYFKPNAIPRGKSSVYRKAFPPFR